MTGRDRMEAAEQNLAIRAERQELIAQRDHYKALYSFLESAARLLQDHSCEKAASQVLRARPFVPNVPIHDESNARRVKACLAMCEGVSTLELETAPAHLRLKFLLAFVDDTLGRFGDEIRKDLAKLREQP